MKESVIGREVFANYGAMHPEVNGVIKGTRVFECRERQVLIQWDDDRTEWKNIAHIRYPARRDMNGSPIGVFWDMGESWMKAWG